VSYQNGVPVSERPGGTVMPYLRSDGETMRQVEFNQNRRSIEENKRRAHHAPLPPTR
jgi:hypothetical protein